MSNILARLTLRGKKLQDGTFSEMTSLKYKMIREGYPAIHLHVGYAVHKGVFYCKGCGCQVIDPHNDWYNGAEFWICSCKQINYII